MAIGKPFGHAKVFIPSMQMAFGRSPYDLTFRRKINLTGMKPFVPAAKHTCLAKVMRHNTLSVARVAFRPLFSCVKNSALLGCWFLLAKSIPYNLGRPLIGKVASPPTSGVSACLIHRIWYVYSFGSRTVKVTISSALLASMEPPCISTISCAMARPSPEAPVSDFRASSNRKNFWKSI